MKIKTKTCTRIVSIMLTLILLSQIPILAFKIESLEPININKTVLGLPLSDIPEVLEPSLTVEYGNVERLREEETDPSIAVFRNEDGSRSMYLFSEPIWYESESGEKYDYGTQLAVNRSTGAITSINAGGNLILPQSIDAQTPISYAEEGITFTMYPTTDLVGGDLVVMSQGIESASAEEIANINRLNAMAAERSGKTINAANLDSAGRQVEYFRANKDASIVSSARLHGLKNELILDSNNGINRYSFVVDTDGLIPAQNSEETIDLLNEQGEVKANLHVESLTDAQGQVSFNNSIAFTERNNGTYLVTVTVDDEFLNSASYPVNVAIPYLVYPVTESSIEDTYVYSATPSGTNYTSTKLPVGRVNGYYYRSYINFVFSPGMRSELNGKTIDSCYMRFYEFSTNTSEFMAVTGVPEETWSAAALTWNKQTTLHTIWESIYAPVFESALTSTNTSYTLWCTNNIKAILNNTDSQERGFGIYLSTESATSPAMHYRHFASTNNSDNRPYLIINYT